MAQAIKAAPSRRIERTEAMTASPKSMGRRCASRSVARKPATTGTKTNRAQPYLISALVLTSTANKQNGTVIAAAQTALAQSDLEDSVWCRRQAFTAATAIAMSMTDKMMIVGPPVA